MSSNLPGDVFIAGGDPIHRSVLVESRWAKTRRARWRAVSVLAALFLAGPALAAPVTEALQDDAGQGGDAPGTLAGARTLPGPGRYTGLLVTVDDAADAYRIVLARDTYLRVDLGANGLAVVEVLDPDGELVFTGTTVKVYTDKPGGWYLRVSAPLFARYTLDVARTPYPQDDGASGLDAGRRLASAAVLHRAGVIGNLTGAFADCADTWTLPVRAGEALVVRFEWPSSSTVRVVDTNVRDTSVPFPAYRQAPTWWSVNATATSNATWAFTILHTTDQTNGCAGRAEYKASVGLAQPPPPPRCANGLDDDGDGLVDWPLDPGCSSATDDDEGEAPPPPPPPQPEIFSVAPIHTRPGREVLVYGSNFTGATFTIGGVPAAKRVLDLGSVSLRVPVLEPGWKDVTVTLDGVSDTLRNATEVLAPADLAVVEVTSRAPPEGLVSADLPDATREIQVTVANLALNESEAYVLDVFVLGRGQPRFGSVHHVAHVLMPALGGGDSVTLTVSWDGRRAAGSFDVVASVNARTASPAAYSHVEADASNDRGSGTDWVVADPGVGVRA